MIRRVQYDDTERASDTRRLYAHTTETTIYSGIYAIRGRSRKRYRLRADPAVSVIASEFSHDRVGGIIHARY